MEGTIGKRPIRESIRMPGQDIHVRRSHHNSERHAIFPASPEEKKGLKDCHAVKTMKRSAEMGRQEQAARHTWQQLNSQRTLLQAYCRDGP
jgi:hypothetical protein